jgi:transposase
VYIPYRAKLIEHRTRAARWWINLRDSLDSTPEGRKTHDRLLVPLKTSPFHLSQLQRGKPKALQVFKDREGKWWTTVAVRLSAVETSPSNQLPAAILGIDLGINRAVCTTLLTPKKVSETRYFYQEDKAKLMVKYDELVAQLQQEFDTRKNNGLHYEGVLTKLKTLRLKREKVAKEHDRLLVSQLLAYVKTLNEKFELYIALGRLKGIRGSARKGNYKGRKFRGMVHRWSFSRITLSLKHGLFQLGWKVEGKSARFQTVPEAWTSILCWKCGSKGIRPKQSLFVCHTCGFRTNADRNGSLNIARRLIKLTPALRDEKGLGRWVVPEKAPAPKAVRKSRSSKRKSPLPSKDDTSHLGESAAVHSAQLSLLDFGDGVQKSDDDLAVVRTVEKLSATGDDAIRIGQKREAKTTGGIQSR